MAHTQAWNSTFEAVPANADDASEGAGKIRDLKRDIRERMAQDHEMELAANSTTADGRHKKVTLVQQDSEPTNAASIGFLYTYNNEGSAHLHWMADNGATSRVPTNAATGLTMEEDGDIYVDGINEASGNELQCKVIALGAWNMDSTADTWVAHGLTRMDIRGIQTVIHDDNGALAYPIEFSGSVYINQASCILARTASGTFDSGTFDHATTNRGYVTFWYTV